MVLEKTLESPLDCKEIQPVHPKVDQSWVFIGRTDAEAETPIFGPPGEPLYVYLCIVTIAMKLKDACSLEEKLLPT